MTGRATTFRTFYLIMRHCAQVKAPGQGKALIQVRYEIRDGPCQCSQGTLLYTTPGTPTRHGRTYVMHTGPALLAKVCYGLKRGTA